MKKNTTSKALMVLTVVAVVGFGAYAFAGRGMGYGHHGWDHHGPGWHHRGGYGYGSDSDYSDNLSADEIAKLDQHRAEFLKATEDIFKNWPVWMQILNTVTNDWQQQAANMVGRPV